MLSRLMVPIRKNFAFVGLSKSLMLTYEGSTPKGYSDTFICMKRHENISYISKISSTGVASLLFS